MKCLRCGREVSENEKICPDCGYDLEEQKNLQVMHIDTDPDLTNKEIVKFTLYPLFTFILGLLCSLTCIYQLFLKQISIILLIAFGLFFGLAFFFSTRRTLVKMKPVREFGIILSYIAFALLLLKLFSTIFSKS